MTTTAENIAQIARKAHATTLPGGYAFTPEGRQTFEPGRVLHEKRDSTDRVRSLLVEYTDGSRLRFQWSPSCGPRWTPQRKDGTP